MPSLSHRHHFHRPFLRHAKRLLVAVAALTALVALPHARAATAPAVKTASTVAAADPAAPIPAPPAKKSKPPTCQAIMQRLSGSLAGTPSNTDKPGAVLVDVDKAGVTMACSHSDAVAIPVPGNSKTR